jgi:hypothetical protein
MGALATYLRDHHAAGGAGVRLSQRVAFRGAPDSQLHAVAAAIEDDLGSLEQLMRELGIEPSRTKDALARVAEQVARVKSISPFAGSGSTELMDLGRSSLASPASQHSGSVCARWTPPPIPSGWTH